MVEEFAAVFATHLDFEWEVSEELYDLSHVVIVLGEQLSLALGVEQVFGRQ